MYSDQELAPGYMRVRHLVNESCSKLMRALGQLLLSYRDALGEARELLKVPQVSFPASIGKRRLTSGHVMAGAGSRMSARSLLVKVAMGIAGAS